MTRYHVVTFAGRSVAVYDEKGAAEKRRDSLNAQPQGSHYLGPSSTWSMRDPYEVRPVEE